jgi:membrane protein implicated in regulation of membrane protease activity
VVAGALLALVAAIGLLAASLFVAAGLVLVWLSLAADALAVLLLVTALRRRNSPRRPPAEP